METADADRAIRKRVEADGHWGAAGLAIKHAILPKREMVELANDVLTGLGRPFAHHTDYVVLVERLGMRQFSALILKHMPTDEKHRDLLEYNLKCAVRELKSDTERAELKEFISANF